MQHFIFALLLFLFIAPASHAQEFPTGMDNVEINLEVLKPLDNSYTPPPMFAETPASSDKSEETKPIYFKPPLPPKRPKSFQLSPTMLDALKSKAIKRPSSVNQATVVEKKPITRDVHNDTGKDIRIMNAQDIHNSIEQAKSSKVTTVKQKVYSDTGVTKNIPNLNGVSITFDLGSTALSDGSKSVIVSDIVPALKQAPNTRLEIQAFASKNIEENSARRLSLSRALKIRELLTDNGISEDRITLRALGDNTEKLPSDRADLLILP